MSIPLTKILKWKARVERLHGSGIQCSFDRETGQYTVTAFPGGVPTAGDIAAWTAEYEAHIAQVAAQAQALAVAKAQALADNLPSWAQVDSAITAIGSLADAKAFLRKLSRVVYLLAKNQVA